MIYFLKMFIKKTVYFILIANLNIWAYGFVELFLIFQNFIDLSNAKTTQYWNSSGGRIVH